MCKSGSSLIENCVGKHQIPTWLLFRPNAMSYGSLPQRQKGLTLSPLRLGTAGMTLSEQTSNTTLNIPHGVRRSDSPFLPPPPTLSVRLPLLLCLLHLGATSFLLPLAAVVWRPFCLGGVLFLVAPPFCMSFFLCGPNWVKLSLPSFVLCAVFRSLSGFALLGSWCSCLMLLPVRLLVFLCLCCAPFCVWLGPAVSVLLFGCCWLPSLPDVASPPPAVGPVWRPGPVFTLVPPSRYLVAAVTA